MCKKWLGSIKNKNAAQEVSTMEYCCNQNHDYAHNDGLDK